MKLTIRDDEITPAGRNGFLDNVPIPWTSKVDVTEICQTFDLSEPIWLDINIRDFKRHSKTRFTQDNFIDSIDFDYLEIQVIEED